MTQHTSNTINALLYSWDKNLHYAQKLVTDVSDERMVDQPRPNMNHPAWVLSHLNAYHPVIASLLRGESFEDPINHPFGMKSKPVVDVAVYQPRKDLIDTFSDGHRQVTAALQSVDERVLAAAVSLERWRNAMPTIHTALVYLMILHESTHLGQISAWRRILGMPSV